MTAGADPPIPKPLGLVGVVLLQVLGDSLSGRLVDGDALGIVIPLVQERPVDVHPPLFGRLRGWRGQLRGWRGLLGQLLGQQLFHLRQLFLVRQLGGLRFLLHVASSFSSLTLAAFASSLSSGFGLGRSTTVWSLTPRSDRVRFPFALAATRMSTCSGVTATVTVRDWTAFSSGRVKTCPAASTRMS